MDFKELMDWFPGKKKDLPIGKDAKKKEKKEKPITKEDTMAKFRKIDFQWKLLAGLIGAGVFIALIGLIFFSAWTIFFVILAFFIVTIPFAVYIYTQNSKLASMEEHFPDFLRDLAEYKKSGVTLTRAIHDTAKNDYGALSPQVRRMAAELSWGIPFEEALDRFGKRIKSKMIARALSIVLIAQSAGGEVTTILETVSSDLRKLKELEKERQSKLSVYTMTIYMIYLLLLFIIVILTESLAPAIPKMQTAGQFLGGTVGTITEFEFRELLFHVSIIEAFFAGLISGEMGEGKVSAGLKHAIVLVLITLLAFQLVQPPPAMEKIVENVMDLPPSKGITTQGLDAISNIDHSFTKDDLAEEVRKRAKDLNRVQFKDFQKEDVQFITLQCTPCTEGKLEITSDEIKVTEPSMMKFSVKYQTDKYVIEFSDAKV